MDIQYKICPRPSFSHDILPFFSNEYGIRPSICNYQLGVSGHRMPAISVISCLWEGKGSCCNTGSISPLINTSLINHLYPLSRNPYTHIGIRMIDKNTQRRQDFLYRDHWWERVLVATLIPIPQPLSLYTSLSLNPYTHTDIRMMYQRTERL